MSLSNINPRALTRRDFFWLTSVLTTGTLAGCAVNPVTGKPQLMLMSEAQEIQIDKKNAPHQLSADYGTTQDKELAEYIAVVGNKLSRSTQRPQMPYSFSVVNANYVNAYAFPGGTIAATRGIMLSMESEAELAGLLGHELGHVNARHTASRMTKGTLLGALLAGGTAVLAGGSETTAGIASAVGGIGAGLLLARYSRGDERQADSLGMQYMTQTEYSPQGMVDLMDMLRSMNKRTPNALEVMFSTHPMSDERFATAQREATSTFRPSLSKPVYRERYMDNTAKLRRIKKAVNTMQEGEKEMGSKNFAAAEKKFASALKMAPYDYTGLCLMSKCQYALGKYSSARSYAEQAKKVYPGEGQAIQLAGLSKLQKNQFDGAYADFVGYEKSLPGNPGNIFLMGFSLEGMQRQEDAAKQYYLFLQQVQQGEQAQYAYQRLVEWGYIKPNK